MILILDTACHCFTYWPLCKTKSTFIFWVFLVKQMGFIDNFCLLQQGRLFLLHGYFIYLFFKILLIFVQTEGKGRRKRRRDISVWLPLICPQLGTLPIVQACAVTGNGTDSPLVHRPVAQSTASHQPGLISFIKCVVVFWVAVGIFFQSLGKSVWFSHCFSDESINCFSFIPLY